MNTQSNLRYLSAKTQFVYCAVRTEIDVCFMLTRLQHVLAIAYTASRQPVAMSWKAVFSLSPCLRWLVASLSPWLRRLVASLSPRGLSFYSQAVWHVVVKVTLWQVFLCHYHCYQCCVLLLDLPVTICRGTKVEYWDSWEMKETSVPMWQHSDGRYHHLPVQGHTACCLAQLTGQLHKQLSLRTSRLHICSPTHPHFLNYTIKL